MNKISFVLSDCDVPSKSTPFACIQSKNSLSNFENAVLSQIESYLEINLKNFILEYSIPLEDLLKNSRSRFLYTTSISIRDKEERYLYRVKITAVYNY